MPPAAKGETPLEPQPLPYRGAIWPGASRVTEDRSPLVPGCKVPIGTFIGNKHLLLPYRNPYRHTRNKFL